MSEWIPVSKRLPEIEEKVLVTYKLNSGQWVTPEIRFMFHKLGSPNQGKLMWTVNDSATHWMPLPEPPNDRQ